MRMTNTHVRRTARSGLSSRAERILRELLNLRTEDVPDLRACASLVASLDVVSLGKAENCGVKTRNEIVAWLGGFGLQLAPSAPVATEQQLIDAKRLLEAHGYVVSRSEGKGF